MSTIGIGAFIWKGGTLRILQTAIDIASLMGCKHVALKIGDAASGHSQSFPNMPEAVAAFRDAGMQVYLWHYIYCGCYLGVDGQWHDDWTTPAEEAAFALRNIKLLRPDGYIIDAERELKVLNPEKRASRFVNALGTPDCMVGLSSYRFPSLHPEFPWSIMLHKCQQHWPQVYWQIKGYKIGGKIPSGPAGELQWSAKELKALKDIPIIPIGRAYIGDGHTPTPDEINIFLETAKAAGMPGASSWCLDTIYTHPGGADWAAAFSRFQGWDTDAPVEPDPPAEPEQPDVHRARVISYNLRIRPAPGMDQPTIGWLWRGAQVEYTTTRSAAGGLWAEIRPGQWVPITWMDRTYLEEIHTWIPSPAPDPEPPAEPDPPGLRRAKVIAFNLRIRPAPGMDQPTIGWLWRGAQVEYTTTRSAAGGLWAEIRPGQWVPITWMDRTYLKEI